jgi:hypothetical protein
VLPAPRKGEPGDLVPYRRPSAESLLLITLVMGVLSQAHVKVVSRPLRAGLHWAGVDLPTSDPAALMQRSRTRRTKPKRHWERGNLSSLAGWEING